MADTKISALSAVSAVAAANELAVNEAGTSKKASVTQLTTYLRTIGMPYVVALASDAAENETTSMVGITGLDVASVDAGTYVFEYYLRCWAISDAAQSLKFAVSHSGTVDAFMCSLKWPSAGVSASTGAVDQDAPAITTGSVWAHQSTRTKGTTLGPQTGVDAAGGDVLYRISGLMVISTTGTMTLTHGSELTQANGTTVKKGSCLILTQVA